MWNNVNDKHPEAHKDVIVNNGRDSVIGWWDGIVFRLSNDFIWTHDQDITEFELHDVLYWAEIPPLEEVAS